MTMRVEDCMVLFISVLCYLQTPDILDSCRRFIKQSYFNTMASKGHSKVDKVMCGVGRQVRFIIIFREATSTATTHDSLDTE